MKYFDTELSKQHYKILKFCYGKHHVSYTAMAKKFGSIKLHAPLSYLRTHNMILQEKNPEGSRLTYKDEIYLSALGETAYLNMRDEYMKFWKNILVSKWLDILVAFITAAITSTFWPRLLSFLVSLTPK